MAIAKANCRLRRAQNGGSHKGDAAMARGGRQYSQVGW